MKLTIRDLKALINEVRADNNILLSKPQEVADLNEMASFNRARDHVEQRGVEFVMISAYRGGKGQEGNKKRHKEMKQIFKGAGYPFVEMLGGYSEEEHGDITEPSLLVLSDERGDASQSRPMLFKLAAEVSKRYDQDSFIFGQPAKTKSGEVAMTSDPVAGEKTLMDIRAYSRDGSAINEPWAGPWNSLVTAKEDDIYWSVVAGRKAKLAEIKRHYESLNPGSRTEAMKKDKYLKSTSSALTFLT